MELDLSLPKSDIEIHELHLYREADELSQECWGVPFSGEIEVVERDWKCYHGYYLPDKEKIVMSITRNRECGAESTSLSLLHELVHWRLHMTGRKYNDDDQEFVEECLWVGAPLSGTKAAKQAERRFYENREEEQHVHQR